MAVKTQRGIRVHKEQWETASKICERMNTNLSAVINQLIAQIIIQERIPFSLYANRQDEEEILLPEWNEKNSLIREENVPDIGTRIQDTDETDGGEEFFSRNAGSNLDWASLDVFGTHPR